MPEAGIPIDRTQADAALQAVTRRLPSGWLVMPIGALGMMNVIDDVAQRTKDVDLVPFLVVDQKLKIPPTKALVEFANTLSDSVTVQKDQTNVTVLVPLEAGKVKVELIRGRNPASGGYFVTRRVLEACASISLRKGNVLELPAEGMAFLKAWAATDQDKLVAAKRDPRGFHAARAAAFRQDVSTMARSFLGQGKTPPTGEMPQLLSSCPIARREPIEGVLRAAGWSL